MLAGAAAGNVRSDSRRFLPIQEPTSSVAFPDAGGPPMRRRSSGGSLADLARVGGGTPQARTSLAQVSSFRASAVLDSMGLDWTMHTPLSRNAGKSKFFDPIAAATEPHPPSSHARHDALIPVIHPDRLFYRVWTNVLLILLIWTATVTPFQVSAGVSLRAACCAECAVRSRRGRPILLPAGPSFDDITGPSLRRLRSWRRTR